MGEINSKVDVWMPLYVADYLADTTRLTTEQHGAYLLLLMDYWRNGPLPDNDAVLAQITRMSSDAWSNARSILQAFFEQCDGMWKHGRVEAELAKAAANRQVSSIRAKAAANARWNKQNNASSNAPSITQAMPVQCPSPSPSPSTSTESKPEKPKQQHRARQVALSCPDGVTPQVWDDYLAIRKAKSAPMTDTALRGIEREANNAGVSLQAALETCCQRGWTGFKAEWVRDQVRPQISRQQSLEERNAEASRRAKELIFGKKPTTTIEGEVL